MKLEDLIPEKPTFTLASTSKEYTLRVPNLEDKVEISRMCGGAVAVTKAFEQRDWTKICPIVYRLMIDKSDFLASKEKKINDDGFETETMILGPIKLLRAIQTQSESIALLGALTTAITASEPLIEEYVRGELKKSLENNPDLSTGESSSTPLPPSTDTPSMSSNSLRIEN